MPIMADDSPQLFPDADPSGALDRSVVDELWQASAEGQPDFIVMLIQEFLQEATSQVSVLIEHPAGRDSSAIQRVAHNLKGSASMVGAVRLAALCHRAELHGRQHPEQTLPAELIDALSNELEVVRAAFANELERRR